MRRKIMILTALFLVAACSKDESSSSFVIEEVEQTVLLARGQSVSLSVSGSNIKVCTAKAPKGWKAKIMEDVLVITAPDVYGEYSQSGQVGVYARGEDDVEYAYNIPVRTEALIDKDDWTMVYSSSRNAAEGSPAGLIDDSYTTFWSSGDSDASPFYLVIDLGKPQTVSSLDVWARMTEEEIPVPVMQCAELAVDFATQIKSDGMADLGGYGFGDWSFRSVFSSDVLANTEHNMVNLLEPVTARYVRIHYRRAWSGAEVLPVNTPGGSLAEIDIYGY